MVKVSNMTSPRSGNDVPNQFIIETKQGIYFQSYRSVIIAFKPVGAPVQLDKFFYDYSRTTVKYRNQFLGCTSKDVEERIKSGRYILTNLNN